MAFLHGVGLSGRLPMERTGVLRRLQGLRHEHVAAPDSAARPEPTPLLLLLRLLAQGRELVVPVPLQLLPEAVELLGAPGHGHRNAPQVGVLLEARLERARRACCGEGSDPFGARNK